MVNDNMIWLALVSLGSMSFSAWLVRENRRLTQMLIARHSGDFTAMVRAEKATTKSSKKADDEKQVSLWRVPAEGVSP